MIDQVNRRWLASSGIIAGFFLFPQSFGMPDFRLHRLPAIGRRFYSFIFFLHTPLRR